MNWASLTASSAATVVCLVAVAAPSSSTSRLAPDGNNLFHHFWTVAESAGPALNARSCAACHTESSDPAFVHLASSVVDPTGGHVFARLRVNDRGAIEPRAIPAGATVRRAPALAGLGLLERVAAEDIAAPADPDDTDGDGVSGRVPSGRFGWKARFPTLTLAVAAAFANELGLSTPYFADSGRSDSRPPELTDEQVESDAEYVRTLAPRRARPANRRGQGRTTFDAIGCAACHRPAFEVRDTAGRRSVRAFTDLLLHDMGPALADGLVEGNASGQEFRTPPLWGLSHARGSYLHDGRAPTPEAAILVHGGEAARAAEAYRRLPVATRRALLRFLASL